MVSFGKCCNPIPGDEMIGFITRGRGVTVHHSTCKSLPLLNKESDRLIPVEWDVGRSDIFNVRLKVESIDRKGMLREITEVISSSPLLDGETYFLVISTTSLSNKYSPGTA